MISMSGDLSGRPASSSIIRPAKSSIIRPALERKTVMGAAAAAAGDPAFGDQSHLFPACLVLNADFSPLSYVPLSLWSWKDTVRAVFRGSAQVVTEYDEWIVRSPNLDLNLPSVIALKARPFFTPFRRPTHTDYPHLPAHAHTHAFTAHAPPARRAVRTRTAAAGSWRDTTTGWTCQAIVGVIVNIAIEDTSIGSRNVIVQEVPRSIPST